MAYPGFTQPIIEVLLVGFEALLYRGCHIDLEQDVYAAAQIEAETHRVETETAHPCRQPRCERQGDVEIAPVTIPQLVAGRRLIFCGLEPHHRPIVLQVGRLWFDIRGPDRADEFLQLRLGNRFAETISQLDRRNAAVEIGQGQEHARQQCDEHQHVEPGGIFVHRNSASSIRLLQKCPLALPARRCPSES